MEAIPSQFVLTVLWLACVGNDDRIRSTGSGMVFLQEEEQYIVTARHVVEECKGKPFLRHKRKWHEIDWQTVAEDEEKDIIVLKTDAVLTKLSPEMGTNNTFYGTVGRALGFPKLSAGLSLREQAEMFGESGGRPLPIPAIVAGTTGGSTETWSHYVGGYVNSGFSGGPVLFQTIDEKGERGWSVVGIITQRGALWKEVAKSKGGEAILQVEPTGMIRFTKIEAVLDMLR